jgi:WD40 repeat protein
MIVKFWDLERGVEVETFGNLTSSSGVEFSQDALAFAYIQAKRGEDKGDIKIWDRKRQTLARSLGTASNDSILRFDPQGNRLISAGADGQIRVFDSATGKRLLTIDHKEPVDAIDVSSDGRRLVSAGDTVVAVWDLGSGSQLAQRTIGHTTWTALFLKRDSNVAFARADRLVTLCDADLKACTSWEAHQSEVNDIASDGEALYSVGDDGTVRKWDLLTHKPLWHAALLSSQGALYSHRGVESMQTAKVRRPKEGWELAASRAHGADQHKTGTLCLTTYDDEVDIWNTVDGKRLATLSVSGVKEVAALPDNRCALLTADSVTLHGASMQPLPVDTQKPSALAYGNGHIYVADAEGVHIVDLSGKRIASLPAAKGISAIEPGPHMVVAGRQDGDVQILSTGKEAQNLRGAAENVIASVVTSVAIGANDTVAVGHQNGVVQLWNLREGVELFTLNLHGPALFLRIEGNELFAATELGDHLMLDLESISAPWCDVLQDVWRNESYTWGDKGMVREEPSQQHVCAPESP